MTFPNRVNYRQQSRETSQQAAALTAGDSPVASFATFNNAESDGFLIMEEKPETSLTLCVTDHALWPLTHKFMTLIAQPAKLLAALLVNCDTQTSKETFWAKATAYQHSELQGMATSWCRILEDVEMYELSVTDTMMLKATLFYWRMWQSVCIACVDTVASIEESAISVPLKLEAKLWTSVLQKRTAASISPPLENKCIDALSQGMILSGGSGMSKRSRINRKSNEFLIAWFLAHKDNPYPSPDERLEIADKTGLAEQQVRNWFANMRKRHWKPNRANVKKPRCLVDYMLRQTDA
ncbi:hypothetical protein CCR75_002882 [Bremia lactucae]|uniref:Homeobox domain-containing protein n=1 Tax=Bremia lactucae TaxID=4779 RepID=A0A976FMH7_BRELC|nr:hypothetical protein CCR75_002882 [Bremia lactucae]